MRRTEKIKPRYTVYIYIYTCVYKYYIMYIYICIIIYSYNEYIYIVYCIYDAGPRDNEPLNILVNIKSTVYKKNIKAGCEYGVEPYTYIVTRMND